MYSSTSYYAHHTFSTFLTFIFTQSIRLYNTCTRAHATWTLVRARRELLTRELTRIASCILPPPAAGKTYSSLQLQPHPPGEASQATAPPL
jgi:hypothetical protein